MLPRTRQQQADYNSLQHDIVDRSGDHVTYVKVMGIAQGKSEEECKGLFLNDTAIARASSI